MAREVDDDEDDSLAPLGDGTADFLQEVKKGKPRRFLLICKGNKVRFLQVKKKGIKQSEVTGAKKLGYKGEVFIGVITGGGQNLVFNLSLADGYTAEPCKEKSLKDFLADQADFKCHPTFALLQAAPEVPFEDEDLQNPVIARFVGLTQLIAQACEKSTGDAPSIQQKREQIRQLLLDENFNQATESLNSFEQFLQSILSGQTGSGNVASNQGTMNESQNPSQNPSNNDSTGETQTNGGDSALRDKLSDTLKKLVPQIKNTIANAPDQKTAILDYVNKAKELINVEKLIEARQAVVSLAQLLKTIGSPQVKTTPESPGQLSSSDNDLMIAFRKRQSLLEPKYLEALRSTPEKASAFTGVWAYAEEHAGKNAFDKANQALDRLSSALDKLATAKTDVSINTKIWEDASRQVRVQLRRFQLTLRSTGHPTALQIVDVLDALHDRLEESPQSRQEAQELDSLIETDPAITSYEKPNPFGITVEVRKPLRKALSEMLATMPS